MSLIEGEQQEDGEVPERVADGHEQDGAGPLVEDAPEQPADGRGQDEDRIAARDVDGGVDGDRERQGRRVPELLLPRSLEIPPPEELLAGADDEQEREARSEAAATPAFSA